MSWDRYHITADFDVWAESEDQAQQFASLALEYYDRASGAIPVQGIGAPEGSVTVCQTVKK